MLHNPPTDNLYKFITFLGVALIMFSAWSYSDNSRKIDEALLTAEFELQSVNSQTTIIEDDVMEAQNEVTLLHNKLTDPAQKPAVDSAEFAIIKSLVEKLEINKERSQKSLNSLKQRSIELSDKIKTAKITATSLISQNKLLMYSFILGLIMSGAGFGFWYSKHQRYQDELLRISIHHSKE